MDLLECAICNQRFITTDAGEGQGWACPRGPHDLRLVVRSLPGTRDQIEEALDARFLQEPAVTLA
jgi:hypothetical protein